MRLVTLHGSVKTVTHHSTGVIHTVSPVFDSCRGLNAVYGRIHAIMHLDAGSACNRNITCVRASNSFPSNWRDFSHDFLVT